MNKARSEEDRGQEADGKKGSPTKQKHIGGTKTCLLKHEIALYTESTEAVCGKSDCLNTPFVTQSFHYILGIL